MNAYRYSICLRFRHPSIDPASITKAFKLKPQRSWQAGEARKTPKGERLTGMYRESYWTSGDLARGRWPGKRLSEKLSALADRMERHRKFLSKFSSQGGRTEFFVGWHFLGNSGDVLPCDLMERLAKLKIDLSLDVYPPDQPQNGI
jgi:Domain of unknown function (DUF4279)